MSLYDYSRWSNFTKEELVCQHTGKENPNVKEFTRLMDRVQALRSYMGIPFRVNSAYRHPTHPIEAKKAKGGMHTYAAIDIWVPVEYCHKLVDKAFLLGFTGIGINLKGAQSGRFIHLDIRPQEEARIWSY